ncbi:hypothetical protein ACSBR1_000100 [Camellia fascicularis]
MDVVEAIVSVVKQKLTDMEIEETVVFDKVKKPMKEIKIKLKKMGGFFIDNSMKVKKDWTNHDYLRIVYQVEDDIEKIALSLERQRFYFLFFFNNRKSCRKLHRKIDRIGSAIETEINRLKKLSLLIPTASLKYLVSDENGFENNINESSHSHHQQNNFGHSVNNIIIDDDDHHQTDKEDDDDNQVVEYPCPVRNNVAVKTPSLRQQRTLTFSFSYEEEESGIVGIQEDVNALVKRLKTSDDNGGCNAILSIVGAVGSGKTTLAQAIYKSKGVKRYFNGGRAWVFFSKDYKKEDLLLSLLKQLESSKDKCEGGVPLNPEQVLVDMLSSENRYLVVVDNVHADGGVWDELKHVFLKTRNGYSKIILTTCHEQVGNCSSSVDLHRMKGLNRQESWKMFLNKARPRERFTKYASQDQNMVKILEICQGMPLRIVLLAGLLSTKSSDDELSQVLEYICRQCHAHLFNIQSFCYHDLPADRKLCLIYLALFPKEFDIPVRRLVRLWLAEGFVKRSPTMASEDVAGEYFEDLVNRNLIQISKFRSDGSPRRCRLPSALHDYLLGKTQEINLFHVHRSNFDYNKEAEGQFVLRRIVEYQDIKNCSLNFSQLQYLRSYISFNIQKKDIPAREVANFVKKIIGSRGFGLLRVLDLEGVCKPSLPDKLGVLFNLRYLGLRWTFLDNLPKSVGDLPNLETLDLKHTNINSLPNSIWKLKHLRHLNLNEIRLDMPKKPLRLLPGLLTLWGLFVDDKSSIKNGLSKLHDLRELGITFNLILESSLDLADWISELTSLQSLRLRSKDERGRPSKLHLKSLSALDKLSHLNLLGSLQKLPDIHDFPSGLKVLTLSISRLTEDPMPTLGQLQSLTVLRLLANSYLGTKIVCPVGGFCKLKGLKLWMLNDLVEWDVEEGAMPNLKELNIRCCYKLSILPPILLNSLEELVLTKMPEKFVANVRQQKRDHTYLTVNDHWSFTSLPVEWEEE